MTAESVTMTAKVDAVMAENAHMKTETQRMRARLEAMEQGQKPSTTTAKTETELNSSGEECQVKKGTGRIKSSGS